MRVAFVVGALGWLGGLAIACGGASFSSIGDDGGGGGGGDGGGASSSGSGSGGASGSGSGSSSGTGSSGGTSSSSGSGSSGASSGTTSSSSSGGCATCNDGGPAPVCPPVPGPGQGSPCKTVGLACEYGASPVQSCDIVATCDSTMLWQVAAAGGTDCGAPLSTNCPATFDVAVLGGACSNSYLLCDYPRGRCECASSLLGAEQPLVGDPPIMLLDSSVPADHWVCQDPITMGCPMPRPPLGSFCSQPQLSCDYGSCDVVGGTTEVCEGGVWRVENVACPG